MSTKKVIEITKELYDSCVSGSQQGVKNSINKLQEYIIGDEKDIDLHFMTNITYPTGMDLVINVLIPTRVCSIYNFELSAFKSKLGQGTFLFAKIQKVGSESGEDYHEIVLDSVSDLELVIVTIKHLYEKENLEIN